MGGKRAYDPAQRVKLNLLREVHDEYTLAKKELRAKIEEQYRVELEQFEFRESRLMNQLKEMNVAKTDIGLAVRLANWGQLEAKYALTAHEFESGKAREATEFTLDWSTWDAEKRQGDFVLHFATVDGVEFVENIACKVNHDEGIWWAYPVGFESPMERAIVAWRSQPGTDWYAALGERVGRAFEGGTR